MQMNVRTTIYAVMAALLLACLLTCACTDSSGQAAPAPAATTAAVQAPVTASPAALGTSGAGVRPPGTVTPGGLSAAPTAAATAAIAASPTVGVIITPPAGAESVNTFMKHRAYETKVSLTGEAVSVGEPDCTCFVLTDDGTNLRIWYDMKVLPDGTSEPAVSIKGLKNENRVLVTGVLKSGSNGGTRNEFWATEIVKVVG